MSVRSPTETIRALNSVFERHDFVAVRDALESSPIDAPTSGSADLDRLVEELISPRMVLEFEAGTSPLDHNRHQGRNDWMAVWRRWLAAFDEYTLEHGNYEEAGELVLVDVTHRGRGRGSGLEVELFQAQLWRVRDGRVIYGRLFGSRAEAAAAAAVLSAVED